LKKPSSSFLPPQVEYLAAWFERLRVKTPEPDFLARAKAVWGGATGRKAAE